MLTDIRINSHTYVLVIDTVVQIGNDEFASLCCTKRSIITHRPIILKHIVLPDIGNFC